MLAHDPQGRTHRHALLCVDRRGQQFGDRHAIRKDGQVAYTGESVFSANNKLLTYAYSGSTGFHLTGPMHVDCARLVFDDTDKTGSETFWRQIDASHFEEVTTASPKIKNPEERKAYELVADETP